MEHEMIEAGFRHVIADRLGYVLRRASAVMMNALGATLAQISLRPVEATILILIGANTGCTQSEVGRVLGIKRANMVPLIADLLAKGLIEKRPVDGRSHALSLTFQGAVQRDAAEAIIQAHEDRFEALISPSKVATLRSALEQIAAVDNVMN